MKKALLVLLSMSLLGGCIVHESRHYSPGITPTTKADVIAMTQAGYSDEAILDMVRRNGVQRRPAADDLIEMQQAGVSSNVMNSMVEAPVTTYRPPVEHRTVYYRDYTADPGFILGVGALTGYLIGRHYRH
jgi:hypothetical protein